MSVNNITTVSVSNVTSGPSVTSVTNVTNVFGAPFESGFNFTTTTQASLYNVTITSTIDIGCCYWSSLYYFYILLIIFLCLVMTSVAAATRQRKEVLRQVRQRAQANGNQGCGRTANANANVCFTTTVTPKTDAPPAYEDVVQNYIDAKQQLQAAEEGAIGGGNPLTVSTTTLETVLESGSSAADLNAITSTNRTTTTDLNHNHIV